jgi:hypothetical protein
MRLFGRRHHRLSEIWSCDNGNFASYGASLTEPLRVSIGPSHKAFCTPARGFYRRLDIEYLGDWLRYGGDAAALRRLAAEDLPDRG